MYPATVYPFASVDSNKYPLLCLSLIPSSVIRAVIFTFFLSIFIIFLSTVFAHRIAGLTNYTPEYFQFLHISSLLLVLAFKLLTIQHVNRNVTKPTKWHVCTAKTQISLGIRPVRSESSLCAQWVAKDPSFLHADSEDTDQTGWMPRLIHPFWSESSLGAQVILLILSWGGSCIY